jgi:hypothetical protein
MYFAWYFYVKLQKRTLLVFFHICEMGLCFFHLNNEFIKPITFKHF